MKVLLTGGGTAGHINPALAIAGILKENISDVKFLFVGTPDGMEATLIPKAGYAFESIPMYGFQRKISVQNFKRNITAVNALAKSEGRAKKIIEKFCPDVVIGTGGYVSYPIVKKAAKMYIPTLVHESNAIPGLTIKWLAKYVDKIMLTVPDTESHLKEKNKCILTGLPVRTGMLRKTREQARKELGLDDNLTILSFGGSLGSGKINECMLEVMQKLRELDINIIHGYGQNGRQFAEEYEKLKSSRIKINEYIYNMSTCLQASDLVICRSGASTLAELETVGRASILIPSPIVANNHQFYNAKVLSDVNAAILIEQKNLTPELLRENILKLYQQPNIITRMSQNAALLAIPDTPQRILDIVNNVIQQHNS